MKFNDKRDLAMCGLACVLCSDENCSGCKARGCKEGSECSVYKCTSSKMIDGCYQCDNFPCEEKMLQGTRNRAFNRYAKEYGKQALLDCLKRNFNNGIMYHKPDGLIGDYDLLSTENEIIKLIRFGSHDPYIKCPVLESKHFTLRLVEKDDAEDLLACYSDTKSQEIFDATNCTSDFRYKTLDEMNRCIDFFLSNYNNHGFVRFTILDKDIERAVGTVEMFNATGHLTEGNGLGILRIDLASLYEKQQYIEELLALCLTPFYELFGVGIIVTKAVPIAGERIIALNTAGFKPYEWPDQEREHYWIHNKKQ